MKSDGTFVEKRAQKIFEEDSLLLFSNTYGDENENQGSNSETSISSLMRYEVFYTLAKIYTKEDCLDLEQHKWSSNQKKEVAFPDRQAAPPLYYLSRCQTESQPACIMHNDIY
ncbi:hypothetical protein Bca4012_056225 [Brassica carinata]|uniref:Uncharacterized protein n=1 Tax=Brassica carinata TaxID=52824 RepID=A0A8X8B3Y5_BRACI|nr:hypothetical protein Bca52824_013950 [Brassica carinata]